MGLLVVRGWSFGPCSGVFVLTLQFEVGNRHPKALVRYRRSSMLCSMASSRGGEAGSRRAEDAGDVPDVWNPEASWKVADPAQGRDAAIASLHRTQPSRGSKGRRHREAPSCSHREASIGVARIVVPAAPVAPVTPVVLVRTRSTDVAAITGTASTRGERSPSSGLNSATVFGCR